MAKPRNHYVDPSIRGCAISLVSEAIGAINADVQSNPSGSFYVARERVLTQAANGWVSTYGKEASDMAVRGLHTLAPHEVIERDTEAVVLDARKAKLRDVLTRLDPTRDTKLNRFWISVFGARLYGVALAVAVAGATLVGGGVGEAQAAPGAAQGREWRALALCGVSKPGAGRERACRQFNSAERSGYRGYDSPAGAPRSWELPRAWEIQP